MKSHEPQGLLISVTIYILRLILHASLGMSYQRADAKVEQLRLVPNDAHLRS